MGFSRQENWSGLPFPSPGDLPNPGIKLKSPALAGEFFTTEPPGKPRKFYTPTNGSIVWASSSRDPGKMPGNLRASWVKGPKPRVSADGAGDKLSSHKACPSLGWGCRSSLAGTLASPHPILTQPVGPHCPHASQCVWTGTGQDPACPPILPLPRCLRSRCSKFLRPHVFLAKKRSKDSWKLREKRKGGLQMGIPCPRGDSAHRCGKWPQSPSKAVKLCSPREGRAGWMSPEVVTSSPAGHQVSWSKVGQRIPSHTPQSITPYQDSLGLDLMHCPIHSNAIYL